MYVIENCFHIFKPMLSDLYSKLYKYIIIWIYRSKGSNLNLIYNWNKMADFEISLEITSSNWPCCMNEY